MLWYSDIFSISAESAKECTHSASNRRNIESVSVSCLSLYEEVAVKRRGGVSEDKRGEIEALVSECVLCGTRRTETVGTYRRDFRMEYMKMYILPINATILLPFCLAELQTVL